jgi:hypothetical protein
MKSEFMPHITPAMLSNVNKAIITGINAYLEADGNSSKI